MEAILPARKSIIIVLTPKSERDLTLMKNCRALNFINCMWKLGEKLVADRIQESGGDVFHHLQFGKVKGRSAVDVQYRSVWKARQCM